MRLIFRILKLYRDQTQRLNDDNLYTIINEIRRDVREVRELLTSLVDARERLGMSFNSHVLWEQTLLSNQDSIIEASRECPLSSELNRINLGNDGR